MNKRREPVHPGKILLHQFMEPLKLTQNKLATALRIPNTRIGEIVNGRRAITVETAYRLGRYFNVTPQFWMNLQQHYDLERARDEIETKVQREVEPLPVNEKAREIALT